jgi:Asp/Glu/hydantoin racemase
MRLGVIMLETRFPRPLGDIGNPATFGGTALYERVPGAVVNRVVRSGTPERDLLAPFLAARDRLIARGADLVTTSCGFLVLFQPELEAGCPVPVVSSSLLALAPLQAELAPRGKAVGVITIHAGRLTPDYLAAVGAAAATPIVGTEAGRELTRRILADDTVLDTALAERDVIEAAARLAAREPSLGAVLLECTNMAPYRRALAAALGVPVHDILTVLDARAPGLPIAI